MEDGVIRREIVLEAQIENLERLLDILRGDMESVECPPECQMSVEVCVEEIFVNIAHYAYEKDGGKAYITAILDTKGISLCFRDKGIPYNPLEKEDPDITLSAEERQIGGLGIFMVKNMMNEVAYEYKDDFNCLTMKMWW